MTTPPSTTTPRPAPGPAAYPHTLMRLSAPAALVRRVAEARVVIGCVDGSHMGLAINWWEAQTAPAAPSTGGTCDAVNAVISDIAAVADGAEALRSAVEVILAMVEWVARNDHESRGDHGVRVLTGLAGDTLLLPSQRILCDDLARALDDDPTRTEFAVHRLDVETAMRLLVFLSRAIEQRFGIAVADQIRSFRSAVLQAQSTDSPW